MVKQAYVIKDNTTEDYALHFSEILVQTLNKKGVDAQIIDLSSFSLNELKKVDKTYSFGRLEKLTNDQYIWDFLKTPHIMILNEPLIYALDLVESPYLTLAGNDRTEVEAMKRDIPRVLFFPGPSEEFHEIVDKDIDVVFFGRFFNFIEFRKVMREKISAKFCWVIDFAVDIMLMNSSIPLREALQSALDTVGLNNRIGEENFPSLFYYLEKFMLAKDRFELINAIRDSEVNIYGEMIETEEQSLPVFFSNKENLKFHNPVSYSETLDVLKRAKICLISAPNIRDGAHYMVFSALANGALPIVSESLYLSENFIHGEDILYYKANHWLEVNDWIKEYLSDDAKRESVVASGRIISSQCDDLQLRPF